MTTVIFILIAPLAGMCDKAGRDLFQIPTAEQADLQSMSAVIRFNRTDTTLLLDRQKGSW
jgi:hypothetical protein